ncbi:MAG: sigma-E factor negative regulatory protein [Gammaproteobacteria bacterium]
MTRPDTSSATVSEQLSAWIDDELPVEEMELLIARVSNSVEYKARLARYGLISSTLRSSHASGSRTAESVGMLVAHDLGHRVRRALDTAVHSADSAASDRTAGQQPVRNASRWVPYAAAAAVALVAVLLTPLMRSVDVPPGVTTAVAIPSPPATLARSPVELLPASDRASISAQRLTSYLVYHGGYSGMLAAKLTDSQIVNRRSYAVDVRAPVVGTSAR